MKKLICFVLMCISITLLLSGCNKKENEFDIGGKSDVEITGENVFLEIKKGTLNSRGATIILKNESTKDIEYGCSYEIEIKQNGQWHKINVALNFALIGYELKAGETKEIKTNWENGYGSLAKSTYRIIKQVNYKGEYDKLFKVSKEITIK